MTSRAVPVETGKTLPVGTFRRGGFVREAKVVGTNIQMAGKAMTVAAALLEAGQQH
jgi:hypothetical protein